MPDDDLIRRAIGGLDRAERTSSNRAFAGVDTLDPPQPGADKPVATR
jgi:hypothetical protein